MALTQAHLDAARAAGIEAAKAAASWILDGNTPRKTVETAVRWLDEADVRVEAFFPNRPNLSGEWADSPTPMSLAREIMGDEFEPLPPGYGDILEQLADAWEAGVDETFEAECERLLREALA